MKEVWAQSEQSGLDRQQATGHRANSQVLTNDKQQCSLLYLLMVLIRLDLQSSLGENAPNHYKEERVLRQTRKTYISRESLVR